MIRSQLISKIFLFYSLVSIGFLFSCSSGTQSRDPLVEDVPESQYQSALKANSRKDQKYSGFYNDYQVNITLLDTKVRTLGAQRLGHFMQWSPAQLQAEREKIFQQMSTGTDVFISFFSPERDHDDLDEPDSMWKIYMEVDGVRYEGKIKKFKDLKFSEIQKLYTFHNRFSTAYVAEFNIPTTQIESQPKKIVLTSSLGISTFEYP